MNGAETMTTTTKTKTDDAHTLAAYRYVAALDEAERRAGRRMSPREALEWIHANAPDLIPGTNGL